MFSLSPHWSITVILTLKTFLSHQQGEKNHTAVPDQEGSCELYDNVELMSLLLGGQKHALIASLCALQPLLSRANGRDS